MYNNKRFSVYLPIAFALVLIAGFFLGATLVRVSPINETLLQGLKSRNYDPVNDVISYIKQDYVDSVDVDALSRSAIEGILSDLDPHSQYISAEEFNEVNDPLLGNFDGIGVQFRLEKDTVYIINTIPGGPSAKAGVLAGDRIVKVEGKNIAGIKISTNDVMKLLKGERGTKVNVGILRRGVKGLLKFELTRDVIPTYSIDIAYMPEPGTGYIKLSKFSATTAEELSQALITLKSKGLGNLILDLRGNSGGYLQAAIDVADEFLPAGKLIVYTEGLNRPKQVANATEKGHFEKGQLMVLIDEGSASSSEIVAGALQDNDRATIVGRRSFGKGLVQEQLSLPDGSAIRLTVARYYTPTGRSIQKPYKNGHAREYQEELYDRMVHGEMESQDSVRLNDSLKYTTPGGKTVYGGGGIMPDVYMPVEKNEKYQYYNAIMNKGLLYQFAFEYTDNNRRMLNTYKDFEEFNRQFTVTPVVYQSFIDFAAKNEVKPDPVGIAFSKDEISNLLKALVARNIFDEKGFYPVFLRTDKTYLKALDEMKKMN
ncbi:MAG: S41 family peptidase [Bacteroidales bacterium]|nr:S41 family peptidase [Bacteroidales bacterium]MBK9356032.1 S41 family peptidase [Bacteroidales bacterium]